MTYTKCHYTEMPTPLRTPQTSGHSSFRVSNLPLRSLKSPPSHGSKIIIFHLSQNKCTVSALFLHGFKGCNGYSDLQNTTKGAEIIQRKITMLCVKNNANSKLLKSECSARWALLIRGPGIRVPSSAPKGRQIVERNGSLSFLFYIGFLGLYL